MSIATSEPDSPDPLDPLDLTSLDADSLFTALTAVDKAIPDLLLSIKPILAHLISPSPSSSGTDEEAAGIAARAGVDRYLTLLDKIQFVLRQTVYYLRETKASTSTLRPPPVDGIPTPFASTLLTGSRGRSGDEEVQREGEGEGVELGLYGRRMEARTLREMAEALRELKRQTGGEGRCRTGWRASGADGGG